MDLTEAAHVLVEDHTSSGHLRLTCTSCEATLVRQPYMSDALWAQRRGVFDAVHRAFIQVAAQLRGEG